MCRKCKFSVTSQNLHMVLLFLKRDKGGQERGDYIGQQVGEEESGNG